MQLAHVFSAKGRQNPAAQKQFGTYRLSAVIMLSALFITFFLTACSGSKEGSKASAADTDIEKRQTEAADISDTYAFTENDSLTAVPKDNRVLLQFFIHPSDSNTAHLKIDTDRLAVKNGTAWGKIKDKVQTHIKPIEGYKNYGFDKISLDSADGKVITDDFIFKADGAEGYKIYIHEKKTKHILTIEYDNGIAAAEPEVIYADLNTRWGSVKDGAAQALKFKEGYALKEWRHGFSTMLLTDDYKITDNHPIRAVSKSVVVTVKVAENSAFYTVAKPKEITVPTETRWSAIEAQVKKLIHLKSSAYGIYGWQYVSGKEQKTLTGAHSITDGTFTVSPIIRPKYIDITLQADSHIDIDSPAVLKSVANGTRWKDIKAQADAKLKLHEYYGFKEWRIGDVKGNALSDDYEFIQNTNIYAKAKGVSPYIVGNTYCFGDNRFEMKDIPAVKNGTIGSAGEIYNRVHTVNLSAYQISSVEVSEGWYNILMKNNREAEGTIPKTGMTWYEAAAFCNELTKMFSALGESQCIYTYNKEIYNKEHAAAQKVPVMNIKKKGFRLPTEAEWEWAAQGGSARTVWAGTSDPDKLKDYAWYDVNSSGRIQNIAETVPNALGLYDMSGNAGEWCWNWDDNNLIDGATDPVGPYSGEKRVYRGGTYEYNSDSCKCSFTYIRAPHSESYNIGFRVVRRP